jgi:hypothetical protein
MPFRLGRLGHQLAIIDADERIHRGPATGVETVAGPSQYSVPSFGHIRSLGWFS